MVRNANKISMYAVESDSHDRGCLASNLQDATAHSLGWISSPFPTYPQNLTFAFEGIRIFFHSTSIPAAKMKILVFRKCRD